jgi:hypothetical protein
MSAPRLSAFLICAGLAASSAARANGGPFIVKHPHGDPAAKGVLARVDPSLMPAREERLKVVKEALTVEFTVGGLGKTARQPPPDAPLLHVTASYLISNPGDRAVSMDFGFPILRGFFVYAGGMSDLPAVGVSAPTR